MVINILWLFVNLFVLSFSKMGHYENNIMNGIYYQIFSSPNVYAQEQQNLSCLMSIFDQISEDKCLFQFYGYDIHEKRVHRYAGYLQKKNNDDLVCFIMHPSSLHSLCIWKIFGSEDFILITNKNMNRYYLLTKISPKKLYRSIEAEYFHAVNNSMTFYNLSTEWKPTRYDQNCSFLIHP